MLQFDFDSVKDRVIGRLKEKEEFEDMLFFSANRRLIDAFAEEIAYIAEYDEYLTREAKWDVAANRTSLMAQNSFFNYRAHRKQAAKGKLRFGVSEDFSKTADNNIYIPKYTQFSSVDLNFVSTEGVDLEEGESEVNVPIIQGEVDRKEWTLENDDIGEDLEFTYLNVDDDKVDNSEYSLKVNGEKWEEVSHMREADEGDSKVFTIHNDIEFSRVIIQLGNNRFGKRPEVGDEVVFEFVKTEGEEGNVYQVGAINEVDDEIQDSEGNEVDAYCYNDERIANGTSYESKDSIRVNAPRNYRANNQTLGVEDYKQAILQSQYATHVVVWGVDEINEDEGNEPGTYLPTEENMVYIGGFSYDSSENRVQLWTDDDKTNMRELLSPRKSPTDIIRFRDPEVFNLVFHVEPHVKTREYSASDIRANVRSALKDEYSLDSTEFKKNVWQSQYVELINRVSGVWFHYTDISFNRILEFDGEDTTDDDDSYFEINYDIGVGDIEPETIEVHVRDKREEDGNWQLIAKDVDGNGELEDETSSGEEIIDIATIDYDTGEGSLKISGLDGNYDDWDVRISFGLDEDVYRGNLLLSKRTQIYSYYDTKIDRVIFE